ncbi:MAG TPA: SDR family oxidoreductase [Propionibacteriaceae bacterium]|nr:SDR family oxidoreductase [Propionibacteriaceae bacterium]
MTSLDLSGRTVLVTGGLGALGSGIVTRLADLGATMVVNDVQPEAPSGARFAYVRGDAGVAGDAERILNEATASAGGMPDTVCLHAGMVVSSPLLEETPGDILRTFETNVFAAVSLAQAASRRWIATETPGLLLFTASWVAEVPWPGIASYRASKAALVAYAKSFARDLAPYGIRANIIAPGIVAAGMAQKQWDTEPDYRARASRAIPLGELQTIDSVADTFAYAVSDLSRYLTGSVILADGGASLYPMD